MKHGHSLKYSVNSLWSSDYMTTKIRVNIDVGNGLLPDGIKPLPEPMLTYFGVLCHSPENSFTRTAHELNP